MDSRFVDAVNAALLALSEAMRARATPRQANELFASARRAHPDVDFQLCWEHDAVPQAHHFDAVVSLRGEGSAVVSYCPERGLPMIARGCHVREDEIVRVNGVPVGASNAMVELELAHDPTIARRLVDAMLVRQALEACSPSDIDPSDDELQTAMDGFRRRMGLYRASEVRSWLESRGISQRALEEKLVDEVRVAKLRERVIGSRIDLASADVTAKFASIDLVRVTVPTREDADALVCDERDFRVVALEACSNGIARELHIERLLRCQLTEEGDAGARRILEHGAAFVVSQSLRSNGNPTDAERREAVAEHLFREWLDQRRAESRVEWFWGAVEE